MTPYRTEWMVYHEELRLAGSIDMIFENKVEGSYEGSNLYAEKAEYFNSKNKFTSDLLNNS